MTLRLQCISFPITGFVVMSNMLLQNIAMTLRASIVAAARQGLFFVPFALILPHFFGVMGVYYAEPIADVCSVVTAVTLFLCNIWKILSKETLAKVTHTEA